MAVLWAHATHVWLTAREARDRAVDTVQKNPNSWPTDSIVAIVLAAASTEAFINELAESVAMDKARADHGLSKQLCAFADVIEEIEESRGSLLLKYLMAAQTLRGSPFDRGVNPFQDFATLITLRNDIMHLKPRDSDVAIRDGDPIAVPKYILALQQRGLARTPDRNVGMSWFNRLQTDAIATWATKAAREIILAVLDFIPDDDVRDPAYMFKMQFRNPQL
jgi:hypothetical protein